MALYFLYGYDECTSKEVFNYAQTDKNLDGR
jgi:hypothetical protein